jgi:hypothetical protein
MGITADDLVDGRLNLGHLLGRRQLGHDLSSEVEVVERSAESAHAAGRRCGLRQRRLL